MVLESLPEREIYENDPLLVEQEQRWRQLLECKDTDGRSQISKLEFDYKQTLHAPYLTADNINETIRELTRLEFYASLLVSSAHGTAKTMGLAKVLIEKLRTVLGREPRVLYICNRQSNVRKACIDLDLDCYIDEWGKAIKHVVKNSTQLGICEHSLHHLFDDNNCATVFDIVIYDESENAHFDAHTLSNTNQENLRDIMAEANLQVFMDSDMGGHTYSLCNHMNRENHRRRILIENTYSHLMDADCYMHDSEFNVYARIIRLLEDDKLVACCVGHRDYKKKPWLTTMDTVLNNYFGRKISFHVDRVNKDNHVDLFRKPDEYIQDLIDDGIRLFTHSPVILTGWRCSIPFDNSVNIHRANILTAHQILQGARRFEGIKTFDFYIGSTKTSTNVAQLENAHYVSHAMGEVQPEVRTGKQQGLQITH